MGNNLEELATTVHRTITQTDESQMGFTPREIDGVNKVLWSYECELHSYAVKNGAEKALRLHYNLDEDIQKSVHRAFAMFGRTLEKSLP